MAISTQSTDKFLAALQGEDTLGAVVRAHIHIEQHLNEIIDEMLDAPREIKSMKLEYSQKVQLAVAVGLHPRLKAPLLSLGTIRNTFAHQVDADLTKAHMDNFYKSFDASEKEIIQGTYDSTRKKFPGRPKKISNLDSKDRFVLYAIALRAALLTALIEVRSSQGS